MGQFKPMVKMMTTEPSVELKLKTGGTATFARMKAEGFPKMGDKKPVGKMHGGKMDGGMMDGGVMGALAGRMPMTPPMGAPGAARAMAAKRMARRAPRMAGPDTMSAMPMRPAMKEGGKADMAQDKAMMKKAFKQHDMQEHKGGKGTDLKLKKGGKMATGGVVKSTKPGGYKTGGVVDGQGGFKAGGIIKSTGGTSKVSTAHADNNSAPTGDVKIGNGGGFKKGGAAKKHFATGGAVNDSGHAVAMPKRPASKPVATSQQAGTFKKGGVVC